MPQVLDRFEISRVLGRGGMGIVYLARDPRLGRQVALKILNTEVHLSDEVRSRFLREARAAAAIRHQNVATIYEVGETSDGQPFIVLEYCEGETLAARMRRRPLDPPEFLAIARQIAAALAAAHSNGIIHRDIKSANIIIEPSGLVKILDFGLARLLPRELGPAAEKPSFASTSGQFFGTLHFLAPEQARGGVADERSDLFSAGVVFYQMASGQLPFTGEGPLLVLQKIRDFEPEPFVPLHPDFPSDGVRVIEKLLQKEPDDRYQSARELLLDLDSIEAPPSRTPTARTRSLIGKTIRRKRWLRGAVTAAALLVVLSAAFIVQQRGSAGKPRPSVALRETPIRSMAVLPLTNLANNAHDDFLSVGLADALVTKLQTIPSLRVRPTSAVLQFRDAKIDPRTAREKLQVDGILEGHFLSAGDLVRVNLQLTDARSGYNVWADTVDGRRDDLLKLIDDVAGRTVTGLRTRLALQQGVVRQSEPRSSSPAAYEQYVKARALTGSLIQRDYNQQIAALKRAIDFDPNFAAAYADLAIALSLGQVRGLTTDPDAITKAEWYARQAVRLDPNLAQAHLALGRVFVRFPDRFPESTRETLASLRLNVNDTQALNSLAAYFVATGDLQKAECLADRIVQLDPSSNEARTHGYLYVNAIDPEGALDHARFALAAPDSELAGHDMRANAFILRGDLADAQHEADLASARAPENYLGKSLRAMIAAARGDRAATEAAARSFEAEASRNHWAALRMTLCYAKIGDRDQSVRWARRAAELGNHSWYALVKHPWLQSLQSDPEFQQIVARMKRDLDDVRDDVAGVYQMICG